MNLFGNRDKARRERAAAMSVNRFADLKAEARNALEREDPIAYVKARVALDFSNRLTPAMNAAPDLKPTDPQQADLAADRRSA